jgi:hypothetical protein
MWLSHDGVTITCVMLETPILHSLSFIIHFHFLINLTVTKSHYSWVNFKLTYQPNELMSAILCVSKFTSNCLYLFKNVIQFQPTYLCACDCTIVRNRLDHIKPIIYPKHQATLMVEINSCSVLQVLQQITKQPVQYLIHVSEDRNVKI